MNIRANRFALYGRHNRKGIADCLFPRFFGLAFLLQHKHTGDRFSIDNFSTTCKWMSSECKGFCKIYAWKKNYCEASTQQHPILPQKTITRQKYYLQLQYSNKIWKHENPLKGTGLPQYLAFWLCILQQKVQKKMECKASNACINNKQQM